MEKSAIIDIVNSCVNNAELYLEGEDCNFSIKVVSNDFVGKSTLERQKLVLSGFSDLLRKGDLHALSVKSFTPEEWQEQQKLAQPVQIEGL